MLLLSLQDKRAYPSKYVPVAQMLTANLWFGQDWRSRETKPRWVRYSRDRAAYNQSHSNPYNLGFRPVIRSIDALVEAGYLEHKDGYYSPWAKGGEQSCFRATPQLLELLPRNLKDPTCKKPERFVRMNMKQKQQRVNTTFIDNEQTLLWEKELTQYNDLLGGYELNHSTYNIPKKAYLERVFAGDFQTGGRYYSWAFQNIPRDIRSGLLINGANTTELDFVCHHPRLLYFWEGIDYREDAYKIPGYESNRKAIKYASLIAINAKTKVKAEIALKSALWDKEIVSSVPAKELIQAFRNHHPTIAKYICSGIGTKLQFADSELVRLVLNKLAPQNILALPLHDSFICQDEHKDQVWQAMQEAYKEYTGYEAMIEEK